MKWVRTLSAKYYKLSAEQGFTMAQKAVGECYRFGLCVARDTKEARRWYARAAAKGYEPAIAALDRLGG